MRIVSLLPSATEILFALGAGEDVVGVTFECDFPPEARTRRVVSTSTLPAGLAPAAIDAWVSGALERGEDLYHLDAGALSGLDADLVVTQDLCAVCAVDVSVVDDALAHLGCSAEVLTVDPHTLEEVWGSFLVLGDAVGRLDQARALVSEQRSRVARVALPRTLARRPRVAVLEWTDPPFAPGHWVPEMVELAGGVPVIGEAAQDLADEMVSSHRLPPVPVHAVDANASWARPGTRLVDGIEELAEVLARLPAPAAGERGGHARVR